MKIPIAEANFEMPANVRIIPSIKVSMAKNCSFMALERKYRMIEL